MYPDLSYLLADWFGTPADNAFSIIKMFGLLLVTAFLASAYTLQSELKRKESEGLLQAMAVRVKERQVTYWEIISNSLLIFVLAFKLPYIVANFDEMKADPLVLIFSSKGVLPLGILFGLGCLVYMAYRKVSIEKNAKTITQIIRPHERVPDITMMAAFFGILGAKLFVILENKQSMKAFMENPIQELFSGTGLAIYGGLIVAFIAVMLYVRRFNFPPLHVMDAAAPTLILGYAVGRLGCHFSGDGDWGIVNSMTKPGWWLLPDWTWAYDYPNTVVKYINPESGNHLIEIPDCNGYRTADGSRPIHCKKLAKAVFPTPIYETVLGLIMFALLWVLRKRIKIAGILFFVYCFINGLERFWIEKIRVNDKHDFLGINATQAEVVSVLLMGIGIVGSVYLWNQSRVQKKSLIEDR